MGVANFEGIEGPLHEVEAAGDGVVALGEFEPAAYTGVAVLRQHGQHMRVEIGFAVAVAGQRHGKTDESFALECADHLAADALRDYEDAAGDDVAGAIAPDFDLEHATALELFESGEWLDVNGVLRTVVHVVDGVLTAFLA